MKLRFAMGINSFDGMGNENSRIFNVDTSRILLATEKNLIPEDHLAYLLEKGFNLDVSNNGSDGLLKLIAQDKKFIRSLTS